MEIMEGFLSSFFFPYIRLQIVGYPDLLPVHIDTGFNRESLIPESMGYMLSPALRLGGNNEASEMTYADGSTKIADYAYTKIMWFGRERKVVAYIARQATGKKTSRQSKRDDILICTELLIDCKLEVDFANHAVRIIRG